MTTQIGLDFIAVSGKRLTSCQLIDNGKAIATAEFVDGKLSGHRALPMVDLPKFWAECSAMIAKAQPESFTAKPAPCWPMEVVITPAYRVVTVIGGVQ